MHFDDRLETVLRQPAMSEALARIQYRQLVDILGSDRPLPDSRHVEAGYLKLDELSQALPDSARADVLCAPHMSLRNPRMLAYLAGSDPRIASAAIAAADLSERDWLSLIPGLPVRARGILRHRRDLGVKIEVLLERLGVSDRGLPAAPLPLELVDIVEPDQPSTLAGSPESAHHTSDIATLLKRIESFSKARKSGMANSPGADAPRLPLNDQEDTSPALRTSPFDFATDCEGRIIRADSAIAPMVVGAHIGETGRDGPLKSRAAVATAIRQRQPLRDIAVTFEGAQAISGDWRMDAAPCFDRKSGSFSGYAGRFRRATPPIPPSASDEPALLEADRIRQILHELKTPANAIQFAAEAIQQKMFGPIANEYRALAAIIASDIAYVLAGFDELELLAKLEAGAIELEAGEADCASIAFAIVENLEAFTQSRQSGFTVLHDGSPLPTPLGEEEVERLIWRIFAVLAGEAAPGESLALDCRQDKGEAIIAAQLPASLANLEGDDLFRSPGARPSQRTISAGSYGSGFSLRLARAEAQAAGGSLKRDGNTLSLRLPALTEPAGGQTAA